MDYLNPKKRKRHLVQLFIGYGLVAAGVAFGVVILFLLVLGFSYHDGVIVQNGMMYLNSSPSNAQLVVNGQPSGTTNTRLIVPAGQYSVQIERNGYRPWQRTIDLAGGMVQRYDYPLLIPNQLTSSDVTSINGQPGLVTQSLDQRWLLISDPGDASKFDLVDFSTASSPVVTSFNLPSGLVSTPPSGASESWHLVQWSNDNQHVLLEHNFGSKHEFVLVDISNPTDSVNLNTTFGKDLAQVELYDDNYNQYWIFDPATHELSRANLGSTALKPYLSAVLAFYPYYNNVVLYVTTADATPGTVHVLWYQGGNNYPINLDLPYSSDASNYMLGIAQFRGNAYVSVGEKGYSKVLTYKNPLQQYSNNAGEVVSYNVMSLPSPNYLEFSPSGQFILAEGGRQVSVFNILYHQTYSYQIVGLDSPEPHAFWLDGYHLLFIAGGQVRLADFNNLNQQTLVAASADYEPFLDPSGEYLLSLTVGSSSGQTTTTLDVTPLRLPADL